MGSLTERPREAATGQSPRVQEVVSACLVGTLLRAVGWLL